MITVSLCMIVKNEEKVIGRCLESVKDIVDEINIVDTGSTDKTKEIVRQYTDRVFDFKWIDDFAAARNFSFQQATKEYIFWLDADDVLSVDNQKKFVSLKKKITEIELTKKSPIEAVSMDYHLSFDGVGNSMYTIKRYRLVLRAKNFRWDGVVHEYLAIGGNLYDGDVAVEHRPIDHDSNRNLNIYEARLARQEEFSPRDIYYYANELKDHQRYHDAIKYYILFLDTGKGWVEDNIQACFKTAECYGHVGKEKELDWLLESLKYAAPRPEGCYKIGVHFLALENYETAIYWFKQAVTVVDSQWFRNAAYQTWMPLLQLCVCYDRIGDYESAYMYNELAAKHYPDHPSVQFNREYFKDVLPGNTQAENKHLASTN